MLDSDVAQENNDVFDPIFWKKRYDGMDGEIHRSIFRGSVDQFKEVDDANRDDLRGIGAITSVLDVGCGYGRLLDLMPVNWRGRYLGIDFSPELLAEARRRYPDRQFMQHDFREPLAMRLQVECDSPRFDLAICVGIRSMIRKNVGEDAWDLVLKNVKECCRDVWCFGMGPYG